MGVGRASQRKGATRGKTGPCLGPSKWQGWSEGLDPEGFWGLSLEVRGGSTGRALGALEEWRVWCPPCLRWNRSQEPEWKLP